MVDSPADIRAIFGQNLRQLCARRGTISEVCDALDVNRTQFNRYMSGDSFPRPDLLHRICAYFDVDANILIRRLSPDGQGVGDVLAQSLKVFSRLLPGHEFHADEVLLPSGIYRQWRRSFLWPDLVFTSLCRIWRADGVTHWKTYEPTAQNYLMLDELPGPPQRGTSGAGISVLKFRGVALDVNRSIVLLSAAPDSRVFRVSMLGPVYGGGARIFSGYCALMRMPTAAARSLVPVVYEKVEADLPRLVAQGRVRYFHPGDELPARLRSILMENPSF